MPQVAAREMVTQVADARGREYRLLAGAVHWQGEPPRVPRCPPDLGQHTAEVLRDWLSYDEAKIAGLRQSGAIV